MSSHSTLTLQHPRILALRIPRKDICIQRQSHHFVRTHRRDIMRENLIRRFNGLPLFLVSRMDLETPIEAEEELDVPVERVSFWGRMLKVFGLGGKKKKEGEEMEGGEVAGDGEEDEFVVSPMTEPLSSTKERSEEVLEVEKAKARPRVVRYEPFRMDPASLTSPIPRATSSTTRRESPLPELPPLEPLSRHGNTKSSTEEPRPRSVRFAPLPDRNASTPLPRFKPLEPPRRLIPILKKSEARPHFSHPKQMSPESHDIWEAIRASLPQPRPHPYLHPLALQQKQGGQDVKVFAFRFPRVEEEGQGAFHASQQYGHSQNGNSVLAYPEAGEFGRHQGSPPSMTINPQLLQNTWPDHQEEQLAFFPPQTLEGFEVLAYASSSLQAQQSLPQSHGQHMPTLNQQGHFPPPVHVSPVQEPQQNHFPQYQHQHPDGPWYPPFQHHAHAGFGQSSPQFQHASQANFEHPMNARSPTLQSYFNDASHTQMFHPPPQATFEDPLNARAQNFPCQSSHISQMHMGHQFSPIPQATFEYPPNLSTQAIQPQFDQASQVQMGFPYHPPEHHHPPHHPPQPPVYPWRQEDHVPNPQGYGSSQRFQTPQVPYQNAHPQGPANTQNVQMPFEPQRQNAHPHILENTQLPPLPKQPNAPFNYPVMVPRQSIDKPQSAAAVPPSLQAETPKAPGKSRPSSSPLRRPIVVRRPRAETEKPTQIPQLLRSPGRQAPSVLTQRVVLKLPTVYERTARREKINMARAAASQKLGVRQLQSVLEPKNVVNLKGKNVIKNVTRLPNPQKAANICTENLVTANFQEVKRIKTQQLDRGPGKRVVVGFSGRDTDAAQPPRPHEKPKITQGGGYLLNYFDISVHSTAPRAKKPKKTTDWVFIPDELDELYAGERWPNLYSCLSLKSRCDTTEILPAFRRLIVQHFPLLTQRYRPSPSYPELLQFLRFLLNTLPQNESSGYKMPYDSFKEILEAYREEWVDWEKRPRRSKAPDKTFEEIFLAFIILSNPFYRQKYDSDRDTRDPFSSHNRFFSDLSRTPNYKIVRGLIGKGLTCDKRIRNVGLWLTKEDKERLEAVRSHELAYEMTNDEINLATEELEWEYKGASELQLVQRQKREHRTGWWAESEKLAELCLTARGMVLSRVEGSGNR